MAVPCCMAFVTRLLLFAGCSVLRVVYCMLVGMRCLLCWCMLFDWCVLVLLVA